MQRRNPEPRHTDGAHTVSWPRQSWAGLVAVLAAAGLVAGAFFVSAAVRGPDSDEATLQGFQIRVLNVSQAAAENRLDGALAALEALEKDLEAAAGGGLVSASRYRGIEAALSAVRADITRHIEAQAAVAAVATASAVAAGTPTPDTAVTQPVQPQPDTPAVAPAPEAVPEPAPQGPEIPDAAKDAKGKGKGGGKP
jgi:hypothetical protein